MTRLEEYRRLVDEALFEAFPEGGGLLREAMRYSLLAGGKRIRPALTLEFCRLCGGDITLALPAACGVELLHTYTLIHDDLPCMDDDELRRGRPTSHIVFGEATAVLAGDALQAEAFNMLLSAPISAERRARAASVLARAAGAEGICKGQLLDMLGEGKPLNNQDLLDIHDHKTAALIVASAQIGVICGGGGDEQLASAERYARALGLAFQIRDDMLDVLSDSETLGKPIGSDAREDKTTFMTLFGAEGCAALVREYTESAKEAARGFEDHGFLLELADALAGREA